MRAVFGMTALSNLWRSKNSCPYECLAATMKIQRVFPARANTPQRFGAGQRPAKHFDPLTGFENSVEHALRAIDRRAGWRARGAAIDEDLCALNIGGIVGSEEQHRLRNLLGF